jgi:hypothetical protein
MPASGDIVEKTSKSLNIREWIFGIFIILLVAFFLVPGEAAAMKMARKNAASGNVRQIALSYRIFAKQGNKLRHIQHGSNPKNGQASTPAQYAEVLARFADLRSGEIWLLMPMMLSRISKSLRMYYPKLMMVKIYSSQCRPFRGQWSLEPSQNSLKNTRFFGLVDCGRMELGRKTAHGRKMEATLPLVIVMCAGTII